MSSITYCLKILSFYLSVYYIYNVLSEKKRRYYKIFFLLLILGKLLLGISSSLKPASNKSLLVNTTAIAMWSHWRRLPKKSCSVYLLDFEVCNKCSNANLQEFDLSAGMYENVKNRRIVWSSFLCNKNDMNVYECITLLEIIATKLRPNLTSSWDWG